MSLLPLQRLVSRCVDPDYARPTRVHLLPRRLAGQEVFIKREDETSAGVSGSKLRKYASLIPALQKQGITDAALIGGPNSNHLVGLVQLLRERAIRPHLFVRQASDPSKHGNALLLSLLADTDARCDIDKAEWPRVEAIAAERMRQRVSSPDRFAVIPEGGLCPESLPGALSLALDVIRNEREGAREFSRLYLDSGTGMSAIGLVLGLAVADAASRQREVCVTLVAGTEQGFRERLESYRRMLQERFQLTAKRDPALTFLRPPTAPKFGSVNRSVLVCCRDAAREQGILMDPVYSAKHYMAMGRHLGERPADHPPLFVFNGSPLGLCGFQSQLAEL